MSLSVTDYSVCMSNYGRRALSYAGPHAWNLLAENVRKSTSIAIFKCSLKTTFLFIPLSALETIVFISWAIQV